METLNPAQAETAIITNNLDSTSTVQPFPPSVEDVETEDSNSNTQNSTEESIAEEIGNNAKITEDLGEQRQLSQTEAANPFAKIDEELEDKEQSADAVSMDRSADATYEKDQQQVDDKPQIDKAHEQRDEAIEENCVKENTAQANNYAEGDEEDQLLKSDEEDENKENATVGAVDNISMEQEDELLQSEDEENRTDVAERNEEDTESTKKIQPKDQNEHDNERSANECENKNGSESDDGRNGASMTTEKRVIDDYAGNSDGESQAQQLQAKVKKHNANHRILYQFDLDDDSSEESSKGRYSSGGETPQKSEVCQTDFRGNTLVSVREGRLLKPLADVVDANDESCHSEYSSLESPAHYENSTESLALQPLNCETDSKIDNNDESSNHTLESVTQQIISETTDIKDVSKEQNSDNREKVDDKEIGPTSTKLIKEQSQEVIKESNDKEEELEALKRWNSFENSCHSDEFLPTERESIKYERPKINGDHNQKEETEYHSYDTNDSGTSDANTMKSRKSSLESGHPNRSSHSPLLLPHNEEARTAFHSETNLEPYDEIQGDEANGNNQNGDSDNVTSLKIHEEESRQHQQNSNDHVDRAYANQSMQALPGSNMNSYLTAPAEDDASRSSMASSVSYSTTTSSSQQLVIDHPLDDVKEEKVKPLKISLKRKLSYGSDDGHSSGPQQKHQHFSEAEIRKTDDINITRQETEVAITSPAVQLLPGYNENFAGEVEMEPSDLQKPKENSVVEQPNFSIKQEQQETHVPVFKSLLLQQLEKPIMVPTTAKNQLFALPKLVALPPTDISPSAQPPPGPIMNVPLIPADSPAIFETSSPIPLQQPAKKFLCFKCKTGCFDSFAALTEHQTICLQAHSLFPFSPAIATSRISATPPVPVRSLSNSKICSPLAADSKAPTPTPSVTATKKRYYKCSSCNTFHENWNLFLHIREKHNRHMCLYCARFFPTAEKLALHLEITHDLEQMHFNSEETLRDSIPQVEGYPLEARYLMCCTCEHVFKEREQFSQHDCAEYIKPCALCGQKGRHTSQCKAHPDSKRFLKLKKKKEKTPSPLKQIENKGTPIDFNFPPPSTFAGNHNAADPTIISNSNLSCDSGRAVQRPPPNVLHSEDSNSSSNMVIDESCNTSHQPPPQPALFASKEETTVELLDQQQSLSSQLEPDLPPDRPRIEDESMKTPLSPMKLVVPKLKLRVPKEFQKSVDAALSTSESDDGEEEEDGDNLSNSNEMQNDSPAVNELCLEANQKELFVEATPASSQDREHERNSATESATEAGNSQEDAAYESCSGSKVANNTVVSLDDDDSLDEPNSSLVRIMQEIERTKMDIKRTKKTSFRHNKIVAVPRQATLSQSSNRTADHNWSPTPPASPNSRWFTPRRGTTSQSDDLGQHHMPTNQCEEYQQQQPASAEISVEQQSLLLPPPASPARSHVTQERRDTIGSDMMDIDETITSQPTQTIYRDESRLVDSDQFNASTESLDNEPMDTAQPPEKDKNLANQVMSNDSQMESILRPEEHEADTDPIATSPENQEANEKSTEDMDVSFTPSTQESHNEQRNGEEGQDEDDDIDVCGSKEQIDSNLGAEKHETNEELQKISPADGIEVANEDTLTVDLQLDHPLDKYEIVEFVRICLKTVYPMCLYCNHARRIAVNGKSLVLHMIAEHRFTATVDSITAEELQANTIVSKLKSFLPELEEHYFNSNSYCTYGNGAFTKPFNERIFECFQCRFVANTHKELYLHNRKMHLRTAILCFMCRANFYSFSEILCHICPGASNKVSVFDVKFRCCLCDLENIPSPFRLMVHLRKKHFACDVCLEDCREQSKLSSHVWKHKLHHLCYRCGIAYRNKQDITKHLFWKHGTESTICKKCLQKKWPHVYHFCIPPQNFVCEVCNLCFTKAMYLRVHKRIHSGDFRYPCIEDECEEKFVSRRLLLKHANVHLPPPLVEPELVEENKENVSEVSKEGLKPEAEVSDIKPEIEIKKEPLDETDLEAQNLETEKNNDHKESNKEEQNEEKPTVKSDESKSTDVPRKKRKKSKRSKGLLEDLNLAAPNLSESDSSDGDDSDSDSKTRSEIDAMPRVMLSPPSEAEGDEDNKAAANEVESAPGKVLEIWQNFLKSQKTPPKDKEISPEPKDPSSNIMYGPVHIALCDHDYCKLYEPPPPPPPPPAPKEAAFKKPELEVNSTPETSPIKRKQTKSPRRLSSKRSDASSSSSESSSSSDSSCSCGSNCSCSSSNSGSSSSSSSSEETDSSVASNASMRKRHRKKSERDRMRKRSESISPLKQANKQPVSEVINIEDDAANARDMEVRPPSPPKEPLFYESDLETNESETDEEFYDEHPQKLATELLAQKRAQLMAQTRLSPSHNYDIVENSRPSTPSLPEEVATNERPKIKVKKKKRDRKSSCKGQNLHTPNSHGIIEEENAPAQTTINPPISVPTAIPQLIPAPVAQTTSSLLAGHLTDTPLSMALQYTATPQAIYAPPPPTAPLSNEQIFTPRPLTMPPYSGGGSHHRMSEGSSCSDADGSLKRSKRARRPNKFYGYTSDDENIANGPPLMIGSRAFKPQPPPQLTWRKEDLPTPSKSILNNKNKAHRTPKTPANTSVNNLFNTSLTSTAKKKSRLSLTGSEKLSRKRPLKKKDSKIDKKLPPIPTLKIRPSQIGLNTTLNHDTPNAEAGHYNSSDTSSDDDARAPSSTKSLNKATTSLVNNVAAPILPSQPPPPPTPQTTAFNHRIPPALLPNPDFATLQYFKANNIRYPIRPPAGARQAREGESVYCYCRCPYDEVSEMIACDGENCLIEWFHFECVGIMVAPQGKWFCAECRPKYSEELYPSTAAGQHSNV